MALSVYRLYDHNATLRGASLGANCAGHDEIIKHRTMSVESMSSDTSLAPSVPSSMPLDGSDRPVRLPDIEVPASPKRIPAVPCKVPRGPKGAGSGSDTETESESEGEEKPTLSELSRRKRARVNYCEIDNDDFVESNFEDALSPVSSPQAGARSPSAKFVDRRHTVRSLVRAHPEFRRNRARYLRGEESKDVRTARWFEIAREIGLSAAELGPVHGHPAELSVSTSPSLVPGSPESLSPPPLADAYDEASSVESPRSPVRPAPSKKRPAPFRARADEDEDEEDDEGAAPVPSSVRGRPPAAAAARWGLSSPTAAAARAKGAAAAAAPVAKLGRRGKAALCDAIMRHPDFAGQRKRLLGAAGHVTRLPKERLLEIASELGVDRPAPPRPRRATRRTTRRAPGRRPARPGPSPSPPASAPGSGGGRPRRAAAANDALSLVSFALADPFVGGGAAPPAAAARAPAGPLRSFRSVAEFLAAAGCGHLAPRFAAHGIDGSVVRNRRFTELFLVRVLGVPAGDAIRIMDLRDRARFL
eukprot:tig00000806_g4365.t1